MAGIDTVLSMAMLGKQAVAGPLRRLLTGLAVAVAMTILGGIFIALLIGMALYGGYAALVANGLSAGMALATVAIITLFLCVITALVAWRFLEGVTRLAPTFHVPTLMPFDIVAAAEAFVDGFLRDPAPAPEVEKGSDI